MAQPDALSRQARHMPMELDNRQRTLLTPDHLELAAIHAGQAEIGGDQDLLAEICASCAYDTELIGAFEQVLEGALRMLRHGLEEWNMEEGLLLFQGKVYVPNEPEL